MYPKNSRSALAALVFAGGLWAYKNRDKVRGWLNTQARSAGTSALPSSTNPSSDSSYTGPTRRFDDTTGNTYPNEERRNWTPES